ncbi:MAG TPA: Hsp20/alpha crystallin family protein [Anaerolineales bacterium]|nr:Hsp20/alpha crystallin family protein [Anaerolineales bacterium]
MIVISLKSNDPSTPRQWAHTSDAFGEARSGFWRINVHSPWRPPTDVFETEDVLIVRMEIAGMRESDFAIELNGRLLSIRGVRPDANERRSYYQMEIRFGEFSIEIELPFPIYADRVEASYRDGFLRLVLPKANPRQIHIED